MKGKLALGLMSGTSADGVTAALVRMGAVPSVLRHRTTPYAPALRARVLAARDLPARELSRLNVELGEAFARSALALMRGGPRPVVIGSHGQTVWHGPGDAPPNTLQIAESAVIAERTGLPVVADFRPRDLAAGGQGAPLVPAFDLAVFGRGPARVLLNVGGIANLSVIAKGKLLAGFDVGPGNCLMDLAARTATSGRLVMDRGGALAASGRADTDLIRLFMAEPWFRRRGPKSLERSAYGAEFLRRHFRSVTEPRLPDVLATLALFTARAVEEAVRRLLPTEARPAEIVVSGGGALNPYLMRLLAARLSPLPVVPSSARGMPVMAKEAACFAWMAWRAVNGLPNNCPEATGARGPRILGKIVPA